MRLPVDFPEAPSCMSIISCDLQAHLRDQYLPVQPWWQEIEAGGESKQRQSSHSRRGRVGGQCWGSSPWTPTPPTVSHPCGLPVWLLATSSLVSWAGIKGKHTFDSEPEGGRQWREAEVSKTKRERTVLMREGGKGASLSELSSILLTGLYWNTDIANLIKEGLSCFLLSAPPSRGSSFSVMGLLGAWPGWGTLRRVAAELGQQVFVHASAENARSTISASGHTRARTPGN